MKNNSKAKLSQISSNHAVVFGRLFAPGFARLNLLF
jgi:hypothetical protein